MRFPVISVSENEIHEVTLVEDDDPGPKKGFLDHLEDLRWTLVKSSAAIFVGVVICFFMGDKLVWIFERPLRHMDLLKVKGPPTVSIELGDGVMGPYKLKEGESFAGQRLAKGDHLKLSLEPVTIDGKQVFALRASPAPVTQETDAPRLRNLGPSEAFFVAFRLALYCGITLALPFIIYFLGQFIVPALKFKERKYLRYGMVFSGVLFATGVCFCYFALMPVALNASREYSSWLGFAADEWQASEYIGFVSKFLLGMGLGFQLPVVLLTLVRIGIVNYKQLASWRRYVVIVNLILGAVLTTPEVITQVMMAVPLQLLYELTILIAWLWDKREKKREAQNEAKS